jgi:hypothetical protein
MPLICFRGHHASTWELMPSLVRGHQGIPTKLLQQFETEVIREFRERFDFGSWKDVEVLAYAQHHGAPTRLLDWSTNPLIALWFALSERGADAEDGVVFKLDAQGAMNLICVATGFDLPGANGCPCRKPIHVFRCPSRVERSGRQNSVFTLAAYSEDWVRVSLDKDPRTAPAFTRFRIPATRKRELRSLLVDLGLDPYSIYGDPDSFGASMAARWGFDGLSVDFTTPAK